MRPRPDHPRRQPRLLRPARPGADGHRRRRPVPVGGGGVDRGQGHPRPPHGRRGGVLPRLRLRQQPGVPVAPPPLRPARLRPDCHPPPVVDLRRQASLGAAGARADALRVMWPVEAFVASLTGSSPHTRKAYESDLRQFVAWAERGGAADPASVDHLVLRRYLAYLTTRGMARPTIARKAAALRAFFGWLRHRGMVAVDPTRNLRTPEGDRRLPRVPKAAEVATLLDGVPADTEGIEAAVARRDAAVLEVLYGAGLRISE